MSHTKHSKYSKKNYCPVKCSTDVGVDLDVIPKVSCKELWRRGTDFDVELEIEVDHRCKLVPVKQIKDECDPCKTTCIFKVELDFDCKPKVLHRPCSKPQAEVQLDVELLVEPNFRPLEECKIRYHKEDDEHKKEEKKQKKEKKEKKEKKREKIEECYSDSYSDSECSYDDDDDCECEVCEPEKKKDDKKHKKERKNFWM